MSTRTFEIPDWLDDHLKRVETEGRQVYDWSLNSYCGIHKPVGWDHNDPNDQEPLAIVAWLMNPEERIRVDTRNTEWEASKTE